MSALQDALVRRRWLYSGAQAVLSNVSMDGWRGGKLFVPPAEYDEFLALVAAAIERGERLYLIERRTDPVFKWHADLDMLSDQELDDALILRLVLVVQRALVAELGAPVTGGYPTVLVLRTAPVPKDAGVKTGVHLVAPNLRVTTEQCSAVRTRALPGLRGVLELHNPWEDAFDACVYFGNGLRMLGCRKMEPCPACRGGGGKGCVRCGGNRRVDGGRPYEVGMVVGSRGEPDARRLDQLRSNVGMALRHSSVRCVGKGEDRPPHRRPLAHARRAAGGLPRASPCHTGPSRAPDDVSGMFEDLLTRRLGAGFAGLRLGELKPVCGGMIVPVLHPRHCANVGREHASSRPYLFVAEDGQVSQRCHCPKHGCVRFRSPSVQLGARLLRACGLVESTGAPLGFHLPSLRARPV